MSECTCGASGAMDGHAYFCALRWPFGRPETPEHNYDWQGAGTPLPDGHTIVEGYDREGALRWAIMDQSAFSPVDSDDGVLWLDRERPIFIRGAFIGIPLVTEDGEKVSTPTDTATILYLSRLLHWTIEDVNRGRYYTASNTRGG
jgi:hypothetical protein